MYQITLPHAGHAVELDILLAVCDELLQEWTGSGLLVGTVSMPVYASHDALAVRLADKPEYAFSFDVACRVASTKPDTTQATGHFFGNLSNARWFEKVSIANGFPYPNGALRVIDNVRFTDESIQYWNSLDARQRSSLQERAQALLESDVDEELSTSATIDAPQAVTRAAPPPHRRGILEALVNDINENPFVPVYRKKALDSKPSIGWDQRLEAYFWPSPVFRYESTHARLAALVETGGALARALQAHGGWNKAEQEQAVLFAHDIFTWGGVRQRLANVTAENVRAVIADAISDNRHSKAPMNSGWTKVAAIASAYLEDVEGGKPQVIWDSRVAHSLIKRLDGLLIAAGLDDARAMFPDIGTVAGRGGTRAWKPTLSWPIGYGRWATQVSGSALVRDIRDILNSEDRQFPRMPCGGGKTAPWTSRGVEMVLFMDGY